MRYVGIEVDDALEMAEQTEGVEPKAGGHHRIGRDARVEFATAVPREGRPMSKGMDRKKETKKKPAKSFDEKRAAKREKRQGRGR